MKKTTVFLLYIIMCLSAHAVLPSDVVFNNIEKDTTEINEILIDAVGIKDPQERVAKIAAHFTDHPYKAHTLEGDEERLRVNLDELDCTTFVETVLALAYTAGEQRTSWRDFIYNLERLRYRGGNIKGYASRLHYFSDWVVDNVHRGNFKEVTNTIPGHEWIIKTIDFMSSNANLYPALSDPEELRRIKDYEIGYHNHRFPYIRTSKLSKKEIKGALKEGDIVALVTKTDGLDVSHMGIIIIKNNQPYLMHASMKKGKVIVDTQTLQEYLTKNRLTGIRVIRLND